MASVFVSYSRRDVEIVRKIVDSLNKENIDFWVDWEGIPATSDWLTEVYKGIENSDVFLYVLSPDSIQSRVCAEELEHGRKNGKRIIPLVVRREGIDKAKVPPEIASLNWIYLNTESGGFEDSIRQLIAAISVDYDWIQTHRRLQVRALEWERSSRNESYLLRGMDLEHAERALATSINKEPRMTDLQAEFTFASRQSTLRRQRWVILSTTILSVFFCLIGFILGRYVAVPQSSTSINSGILAVGGVAVLAVGAMSGYLSRNFFMQNPASKSEQPEHSVEKPDALLSETVFISYKREDWKEHVRPLVVHLRERGYKVWIDQNNLEVSENWMDEINEALKVCQRLVLCVSPDSLNSKYVKIEYRYFLHHEKTIFPVILKKADMPAELLGLQSTPFTQLAILTEKLRSDGRTER